jgi:hypothetical protein
VKVSVGRWTTSFTIPLVLSNNSLLARILESDNAENLGSPESSWVLGAGFRLRAGYFGKVFSNSTFASSTSDFNSVMTFASVF